MRLQLDDASASAERPVPRHDGMYLRDYVELGLSL